MTTTDAFKDNKLVIYVSDTDNRMSVPLDHATGNIANVLNFIMYAFMNSGMDWASIYHELSNFVHYKIEDIEFENGIKTKRMCQEMFRINDIEQDEEE